VALYSGGKNFYFFTEKFALILYGCIFTGYIINITLAIIELKVGELDVAAFNQLKSYFNEDELNKVSKEISSDLGEIEIKNKIGILVGSKIKENFKPEHDGSDFVFEFLVLKRFKGGTDNSSFIFSDNPLTVKGSNKDYTKYAFADDKNNKFLPKNRFVLALIKRYADDNPDKDIASITNLFSIIKFPGKRSMLLDFDLAVKSANTPSNKGIYTVWYLIEDEDAIIIQGKKYALINCWDRDNIPLFLAVVEKTMKYKIERQ
jgi:hypothetical protein